MRARYSMFTPRGNAAVHQIVKVARSDKMTWDEVEQLLCGLAKTEEYAEAMDTAVRDAVYIKLFERGNS